jgi:hypothetical protein
MLFVFLPRKTIYPINWKKPKAEDRIQETESRSQNKEAETAFEFLF